MEYISAEEFLKQPKEVREVFLDWWKPSLGDLVCVDTGNFVDVDIYNGLPYRKNLILKCLENERDIELLEYDCPLLTEGQLRKFIEDKTGCENIEITSNIEHSEYEMKIYKTLSSGISDKEYYSLGKNKFLAYWQVATQIAKGEVEDGKH